MVKVVVDLSEVKNELTRIHNELHKTLNMSDNERRDTVNRVVEIARHLKMRLNNEEVDIQSK